MTVEVKEVIKHGTRRWIRFDCPICKEKGITSTQVNSKRKKIVQCGVCDAEFIIEWLETDEALH